MDLSLWIFLLCRLWLCSCSCKGHSSWVWSLRLCIALFCRCCIPTWFICPWFSGESREGKKCTEVRGKGEAEGWAGMRSRWISAGLTSHPLCGSGGWQGCSGCGSRRLRSRDAVPGQGSSSGSSSGCQEKQEKRVQGKWDLPFWSHKRASNCDYSGLGSGAGKGLWGEQPWQRWLGLSSGEEGAERAQKQMQSVWMRLLWMPRYPEELFSVTEEVQRALLLSTAPFQRFPPNPRGFFHGWL